MTVLEKIERCVSLVWDFQEIYGEEDIEDFCRKELRTYPQHNEIMEYFKHIADLEKENAELKEKLNFSTQYYQGEKVKQQLTNAKNVLKYVLNSFVGDLPKELSFFDEEELKAIAEAEQFLKDSEVEK